MASISTPAAGLRTAASARGMCRRRGSSGSGGWCPGPGPGRETPAPVLVQPPQSAVTAPTAVRMADPPPQPDQPPGQPPHSATMTHQVITSWHHAALQTLQGHCSRPPSAGGVSCPHLDIPGIAGRGSVQCTAVSRHSLHKICNNLTM